MLALAGSGEYLPEMQPVDRFLLERLSGSRPRVVCLATAAGAEGEGRLRYWNELGVSYFTALGAHVQALPVYSRQDAQEPALAEQVSTANFVYLSGGRPAYLFATLQGSLVWQAILSVVEAGGVLAGCSAGAMVLGERIPAFPLWRKAFGLLPGALVVPHFDELPAWLLPLLRIMIGRNTTLFGIDGFTALIVDSGRKQVVGKGAVTVWDRRGRRACRQGQTLDD